MPTFPRFQRALVSMLVLSFLCCRSALLTDLRDAGPVADAASPDLGACDVPVMVSKACSSSADCAFGSHQTSCCGSRIAIGFNLSEQATFATAEAACDKTFPACACAAEMVAEDGHASSGGITVTCDSARCMTHAPR